MKTFEELFNELKTKIENKDPNSSTVKQYEKGVHFIGKKIIEEAGEVWMASEYESKERAAEEMSQLIYHVQVMMLVKGIGLDDIYRYL
jgi:phosphoribosyl-ATP pyrophosphohydrolase